MSKNGFNDTRQVPSMGIKNYPIICEAHSTLFAAMLRKHKFTKFVESKNGSHILDLNNKNVWVTCMVRYMILLSYKSWVTKRCLSSEGTRILIHVFVAQYDKSGAIRVCPVFVSYFSIPLDFWTSLVILLLPLFSSSSLSCNHFSSITSVVLFTSSVKFLRSSLSEPCNCFLFEFFFSLSVYFYIFYLVLALTNVLGNSSINGSGSFPIHTVPPASFFIFFITFF